MLTCVYLNMYKEENISFKVFIKEKIGINELCNQEKAHKHSYLYIPKENR